MSPISDDTAFQSLSSAITALGHEVGEMKSACIERCGDVKAIKSDVSDIKKRLNGNVAATLAVEKTKWDAVRDVGTWALKVLAIVALGHYGLTKFIGPMIGQ